MSTDEREEINEIAQDLANLWIRFTGLNAQLTGSEQDAKTAEFAEKLNVYMDQLVSSEFSSREERAA